MCLFLRREKVNGVKKDNKIVNLNNYIVLLRVLSSYWENSVSIQAVFPSHTQSHSIERKKKTSVKGKPELYQVPGSNKTFCRQDIFPN